MFRGSLLLLLLAVAISALPQQCLTHELSARWAEKHPNLQVIETPTFFPKAAATPIPVVIHVVWNTPSENIPNATLMQMMDQLTLDFSKENADTSNVRPMFSSLIADADISFCLATRDPAGNNTTGITRTFTNDTWFDPTNEADDMKSAPKGIAPWEPTSYLNIWICDISSGAGANITNGYTYLPMPGIPGSAVDGIVLDYDHGLGPTFRTLTHEAGHYLGLQHTWGNGGCADDDGCNDTPNTDGPSTTCSNPTQLRCGVLTQYENFMEYSVCRSMFTPDQASKMDSVLTTVRSSLLISTGCDMIMGTNAMIMEPIHITQTNDWLILRGLPNGIPLELLDIHGRRVQHRISNGSVVNFNKGELSTGLYFIRTIMPDLPVFLPQKVVVW